MSLMMKNMDGFTAPFEKLKNTIIPTGWIEYVSVQENVTTLYQNYLYKLYIITKLFIYIYL